MACRFGFTIQMLDPDPRSLAHVKVLKSLVGTEAAKTRSWPRNMQAQCKGCETYWSDIAYSPAEPTNFVGHQVGFADQDGNQTFYGPLWTLDWTLRADEAPRQKWPAKTLRSLMRDLGQNRIDVLKADIGGVEPKLIEQLLLMPKDRRPQVIFLKLEGNTVRKQAVLAAIDKLESAGYSYFVKGNGYTFFK
mmetsp:Transcript_40484/g.88479  ORF Transcript_40484/g.88479 Transcript_40484/m.88479 type:complete len:191 (+) Transcript_40484:1-573(+)